jgi:outer membrane protein TolC
VRNATRGCDHCFMSRLLMLTLTCSLGVAVAQQVSGTLVGSTPSPVPITLEQAITLARANEPTFAAAAANARVAGIDHTIAQAALLPSVTYHNQALYTQANGAFNGGGPVGSQSAPRFIANNAVREYASQAVITDTLGLQQVNAVSRAAAAQAVAAAELEISRRGLVNTVTGLFYQALADDHKVEVARRAAGEASSFTRLTQQRESAREAAHADVVKAQLQQQQRDRDVSDALLAQQKSHLDLGVLLFADPRAAYHLAPGAVTPLPAKEDVDAAAMKSNPELRSAMATLHLSNLGVTAARAAYLPDLALNFTYGIDAVQFAVNGRDGVKNLGYSASATLDIPVWDWLSTQHRVRQSEILRDSARTALTATQRRLIAQLDETYAEAGTSRDQLRSLDQSVDTARESLRLTRLRYTAGEATVLEVVDAQNSLTSAEVSREDGAIRYQLAMTNLQLLTGAM